MTDEDLKEIQTRARQRAEQLGIISKSGEQMESIEQWLAPIIANPPQQPDPEEVLRAERRERFGEVPRLRARLPEMLKGAKIRELEARIHSPGLLQVARSWTPMQGTVVLLGETGMGKTTAAGVMALRCIRDGMQDGGAAWRFALSLWWFRAQDLARDVRTHPLGKGIAPALQRAMFAELLVLDELGWEEPHDRRILMDLIAHRYDSSKPTLITSGQDLDHLKSTYNDAGFRRIVTWRGKPATVVRAFRARQQGAES